MGIINSRGSSVMGVTQAQVTMLAAEAKERMKPLLKQMDRYVEIRAGEYWGKRTPLHQLATKIDNWLNDTRRLEAEEDTPRPLCWTKACCEGDYTLSVDYAAPEQSSKSGYVWVTCC